MELVEKSRISGCYNFDAEFIDALSGKMLKP